MIAQVYSQRTIPWVGSRALLQVPVGHYVELNFTMEAFHPFPCIEEMYLEVRDGHNQSANLLGVFCGRRISSIVRSSGHNMWLKFSLNLYIYMYRFSGIYSGKAANITGKYCRGENTMHLIIKNGIHITETLGNAAVFYKYYFHV